MDIGVPEVTSRTEYDERELFSGRFQEIID
jgi:hypothetical protein